jgi:hypothetical protein
MTKHKSMKTIFLSALAAVCCNVAFAQGFAFGAKGGLTLGLQKWNGQDRDPSLSWNGSLFLESAGDDNTFLYYTELGIHNKGSATVRQRFVDNLGNEYPRERYQYIFQNLSLLFGGKSRFPLGGGNTKGHYILALRGDYNLSEKGRFYTFNDEYVNKFTYGLTAGVGMEIPFGERMGLVFDLALSPDFSRQILVPPGRYYDPITNQAYTLTEQRVTNTAFEFTIGLRFDRSWEYEE